MFQQFSWGQFLVAAIVFSLVWYAWVLLVFYRRELGLFFGRLQGAGALPEAVSGAGSAALENDAAAFGQLVLEDGALMGASRLPEGVELKSSASVVFRKNDVGSDSDGGDRYDQVGLVADVLEELKLIFAELERSGGGKAVFLDRAAGLVGEYGRIAGHPGLGSIHAFIRERAPFALSDAELADLWS